MASPEQGEIIFIDAEPHAGHDPKHGHIFKRHTL
ncbi:transcriptional modulator of MazE-toxin MazF [Furfurilactobacillus rossiae]|nr:transcriptional modulator of MazE-toxin MazF [Furfurilactobacillus rossiae]